jgi:hypothetical protein
MILEGRDKLVSLDARGIHDLIYLDLLPKLNIYRRDLIHGDGYRLFLSPATDGRPGPLFVLHFRRELSG